MEPTVDKFFMDVRACVFCFLLLLVVVVFRGVGWGGEQNCDNHGVAGCSLRYLATETFL